MFTLKILLGICSAYSMKLREAIRPSTYKIMYTIAYLVTIYVLSTYLMLVIL